MAQKTEIDVTINYKEAQKGLRTIQDELILQKQITIEFKRELLALEQQLAKTPKGQLAAQKDLKEQIDNIKNALEDQKLSTEELTNKRDEANEKVKQAADGAKTFTKALSGQKGMMNALDKVSGGMSTQIISLSSSLKAAGVAAKTFIRGLSGMQKALLATGVGALVVALGTIVAYWDEIKAAVGGVSVETAKLVSKQKESVAEAERQLKTATSQDNILKQQGMSEIDIINYKREQTAELIKQIKLQIILNKQATEEAVKSANKWEKAVKGIILTSPLAMLFGEKKLKGFLGIDAEEIVEEGNKTNEALEDQLKILLNTQAGYYLSSAQLKESEILKGLADSERLAAEAKMLNDEFFKEFGITSAQAYLDSFNSTVKQKVEEDPELFSMFDKLEGLENADFDAQLQLDLDRINARKNAELEAEALIQDAKLNTLSTIQGIFGQETAISKAAFALKQLMALKEIQLSFKKMKAKAAETVGEASMNAAVAGTEVAKGTAKAAATLNPFVIASYAVSAAAVIASMISAFSKAKGEAAKFGGGTVTGGRGITASAVPSIPASFNIVGQGGTNQLAQSIGAQESQPIKAYVVASDVSTAQSMERNIVQSASI